MIFHVGSGGAAGLKIRGFPNFCLLLHVSNRKPALQQCGYVRCLMLHFPSPKQKTRKIFDVIFHTVIFSISFIIVASVIVVFYFTGRFVLNEKGAARIDVLEQVSDISSNNRHFMENAMDMVYSNLYPALVDSHSGENIQDSLDEMQSLFDRVGLDLTIDVVINARKVYMTDNENDASIRTLLNSYWYIKHYSGETETSWNLRFVDAQDINSYYLSYGRTVYDSSKEVRGVIIINTTQKSQFRALQKLVGASDKLYILDQNGIVICHSNSQMVGDWLANMAAFEEKYGYDSSKLVRKNNQTYMISNYHDPESGWTFVEEQNITGIFKSAIHILEACIFVVLLVGAIVILSAYFRVQLALRSLSAFTESISRIQPENLKKLPVQTDYQEICVLGTVFNRMLEQLEQLIEDIQIREKEKQRTEYDFLQAQLSPHFVHNTLLTIKSLLAMGKIDQASNMMSEFVELMYIPTTSDIPFVTFREELHLLDNFVSIMNCRTDKEVEFIHTIPEKLLDLPIPRMILQPLIGNSFFHGFAEKDNGCMIRVDAVIRGRVLYIKVEDNGEGISPERLRDLATARDLTNGHHGIGIQNIKKRLKIIYGGNSDVTVQSVYGKFTRVILKIDGYDHPPMNEAAQRIVRNNVTEEDKDEGFGS